jgi:predicted dinucleotide-binding enzyme
VGLQADRGQKEIKLEMQLGLIGLGKMGGNLALQALEKKIDIIGKARSKKPELEEKTSRLRPIIVLL